MQNSIQPLIKRRVPLAKFTSIKLGGKADYFCSCTDSQQLISALEFARDNNLKHHILGSGSNTVFSDAGFSGLVIKVNLRGVRFEPKGHSHTLATAAAGEKWDNFVAQCIDKNLAGLECLSGIPGSVGATPVQNVGAYGQAVADTIYSVEAINTKKLTLKTFTNSDCKFNYRSSRFKTTDKGRFIIISATFLLKHGGPPVIKYPDIIKQLGSSKKISQLQPGRESLQAVRSAVIKVRCKKSMCAGTDNENMRSCGSFFINPTLNRRQFQRLKKIKQGDRNMPLFKSPDKVVISAAWLIEQAGFPKGYRKKNVGISPHHNLALVNYGGSTTELLNLAENIQDRVKKQFGIELQIEPNIIN